MTVNSTIKKQHLFRVSTPIDISAGPRPNPPRVLSVSVLAESAEDALSIILSALLETLSPSVDREFSVQDQQGSVLGSGIHWVRYRLSSPVPVTWAQSLLQEGDEVALSGSSSGISGSSSGNSIHILEVERISGHMIYRRA